MKTKSLFLTGLIYFLLLPIQANSTIPFKMKKQFRTNNPVRMENQIQTKNNEEMITTSNQTLRLIYPQWQGGVISGWMPDIAPAAASTGYFLGAQLLKMLAPETHQQTVEVPVSLDIESHQAEHGISGYRAILGQTRSALDILAEADPARIVTLGGECSVSVAPFTYLLQKYPDDIAIVWIDAHPDINLPGDSYTGYHAMALTACLGMGNEALMNLLPAKTMPRQCLLVGLRAWDEGMQERQKQLEIQGLSPEQIRTDSNAVLNWLKATGASKVLIHFDLDVIDPQEMIAGVGVEPHGMKIAEVVQVIQDIHAQYEVVGLTIAEPMPRIAIKLKSMLDEMPLMK